MKYPVLLCLILFYSTANAQKESAYLAKVCQNGKFGFIDRLGKVVVPLNYDDAGVWGNGLVAVNVGKYTPVEEDATVIEVAGPPGPVTVNNSAQRNSQYKNIEIKKEKKGKWGYCNAAGVLVIPIQFTATTFFSEGMAGVEIDGKWGFIDLKGEILVKPIYDKVGHFSQGLATVVKNGNYGYINQKGEEVIQLRYYGADAFENGYAKVTERSTSKNNNKTATGRLINLKGEAVTDARYNIDITFSNGLSSFSITDGKDGNGLLYGLIDTKGQIIVQPVYHEIMEFSDGLARVMVYKKDKTFNEYYPNYGFIDIKGKEIIKPGLASAESFSYGKAVIARFDDKDDGELDHALIDTKGVFILGYHYNQLNLLDSKHLFASSIKNKDQNMLIDDKGKIIMSLHDKQIASLGHGLFSVTNSNGESIALVGLDKKLPVDRSWAGNKKFLSYQLGLICFCYLDHNGINGQDYKVQLGLLDLTGKIIVVPKYSDISDFEPTDNTLANQNGKKK